MITIRIEGQPLPKRRPRVSNGQAYTPKQTREYEKRVGWRAVEAMIGRSMVEGDLFVSLDFRRKGKQRADLDNLIKSVVDGLQGVVFVNDSQIVRLDARVRYGCADPGVCVEVRGHD